MAAPPGAETAARGELVLPTARTDAADSEKPWTALKIEQHAAVTAMPASTNLRPTVRTANLLAIQSSHVRQ